MGEFTVTPEMIREAEEELGLREIIDAGLSALEEGNAADVIRDAVLLGIEERKNQDEPPTP